MRCGRHVDNGPDASTSRQSCTLLSASTRMPTLETDARLAAGVSAGFCTNSPTTPHPRQWFETRASPARSEASRQTSRWGLLPSWCQRRLRGEPLAKPCDGPWPRARWPQRGRYHVHHPLEMGCTPFVITASGAKPRTELQWLQCRRHHGRYQFGVRCRPSGIHRSRSEAPDWHREHHQDGGGCHPGGVAISARCLSRKRCVFGAGDIMIFIKMEFDAVQVFGRAAGSRP